MSDTETIFTCSASGATIAAKSSRLPKGWKRIEDRLYSSEAWRERYCIRAVVVPIVMPIVPDGRGPQDIAVKAAWVTLREKLKAAWVLSTEAANWALRRLLANEPTRQPGATKCPPMPPLYLYGERDWKGWSQSASAVLRTIEQTYRARRYEINWTSSTSLPNVSYPYPFPVHNAAWKLWLDDGGRIGFEARLLEGRVGVWLKSGPKYKRQRALLTWLIEHPELRGEASIYKKHDGSINVKVVGWFPRKVNQESEGTLHLRTGITEFLVGYNDADEKLFVVPGDRVKKWIVANDHMTTRWRDSMKFEMRKPKRQGRKNIEDMQAMCAKKDNRVNAWIDETIASCVGHAKRRRLALIRLDDTERGFVEHFAWHRLAERMSQVCNREGISFERCGAEKSAGTARNTVTIEETTI